MGLFGDYRIYVHNHRFIVIFNVKIIYLQDIGTGNIDQRRHDVIQTIGVIGEASQLGGTTNTSNTTPIVKYFYTIAKNKTNI